MDSPVRVPLLPAPAGVACPAADGSSPHYTRFSATPPACLDAAKTYTATIVTDAGPITITLNPTAAPKTVNNFVFLAGYHFFDGTAFHRVIPGFLVQGGDPTGTGAGGPGYSLVDELPQPSAYKEGAVAMANSGPNTNGSQFFILVGPTSVQQLNQGTRGSAYSLFGQVTSGMDVATRINNDVTPDRTLAVVHKVLSVTVAAA